MLKNLPYKIFLTKKPKQQTILEVAQDLITLSRALGDIDPVFRSFEVVSEKKIGGVQDVYAEEAALELADKILLRNKRDIRRYEKVEAPDIYYSRQSPSLSCDLSFNSGTSRFSWAFFMGGANEWKVGSLMRSKENRPSLNWYLEVIKVFVSVFEIEQAHVRFGDITIHDDAALLYKFPLGVINYFANDFHIKIPDNLPHVIYEQMPNGKLFYLPSEDINASGETFDRLVNNLFEVMAVLKDASPNYGKGEE